MKHVIRFFLFASSIFLAAALVTACSGSPETTNEPTAVFEINLATSPATTVVETEAEMEPVVTTSGVVTFRFYGDNLDMGTPLGGESTLTRMPHGVSAIFKAVDLTPGDAVTLWWIIFNHPENCTDGQCSFDDVFQVDGTGQIMFDEKGVPIPNVERQEAVGWSSLRADGKVVEVDGTAEFRGHLPIGDVTELGPPGPGLLDSMKAEFHLALRTHGPAIPGSTHNQLNTGFGGCEPFQAPCAELQVSPHKPPNQE